jgi:hypothetical protein
MFNPNVHRAWSGIKIEGEEIEIRVIPNAYGKLGIDIVALRSITGFDRDSRLTESASDFAPGEVTVADARLDCFAASSSVPYYREGFTVVLEPGMAQCLREWLPKLIRVAVVAQAVERTISFQLGRPINYMIDYGNEIVALIVLDRWKPSDAIEWAAKQPMAGARDAEFVAQFQTETVQHLLATALLPSKPDEPVAFTEAVAKAMDAWNAMSYREREAALNDAHTAIPAVAMRHLGFDVPVPGTANNDAQI